MSYHDVLFPEFLAVYSFGVPVFSTTISKTISGRENRIPNWGSGLQKYIIRNAKLSESEFEIFNSFFRARLGQNYAFKYRDPADYMITNQELKPIDSSGTKFQVYKLYLDHTSRNQRIITK